MLMYIRYLTYLRLVIDTGSFAGAALAAGVSQPAISQAMRCLQETFDAPLFLREGRRRVPTDFARELVAEMLPLENRFEKRRVTQRSDAALRDIRIGLTPSAGMVCGPAIFNAWSSSAHSFLTLSSADEASLLARLQRKEVDLVVSPKPRGKLPAGVLYEGLYQLVPRVYATHSNAFSGAESLEDLKAARWGCVGANVQGPVDVLSEAFAVRKLALPRVIVSCPDYGSLSNLVANTDLLAVIPHRSLLGASARALRPLRLREALPRYDMGVFTLKPSRGRMKSIIAALRSIAAAESA